MITWKNNDYDALKEWIAKGRSKTYREIANNTVARMDGFLIKVRLHYTDICVLEPCGIKHFYAGGWWTHTTKDRINLLLPQPFHLIQRKHVWYLWNHETEQEFIFQDGISIWPPTEEDPQLEVFGAATDTQAKLCKAIDAYAEDYIEKLISGQIAAPGPGDCWYCFLRDRKNQAFGDLVHDTNHLQSHIDDGYYVPSLFYNAIQVFPLSPLAASCLSDIWRQRGDGGIFQQLLKDQGRKSLMKYLYKQFGLPY
jgi:hypothetical protein